MQPATAQTSAWSVASWAFFALAVVAAVAAVAGFMAAGPVADEPYVGPVFSVGMILGAATAWLAACACAVLGALFGAVGLLNPAARTGAAWAAVALNAALVGVSLLLMMLPG